MLHIKLATPATYIKGGTEVIKYIFYMKMCIISTNINLTIEDKPSKHKSKAMGLLQSADLFIKTAKL